MAKMKVNANQACFLQLRDMIPEEEMSDAALRDKILLTANIKKQYGASFEEVLAKVVEDEVKLKKEKLLGRLEQVRRVDVLAKQLDDMPVSKIVEKIGKVKEAQLMTTINGQGKLGYGSSASADGAQATYLSKFTSAVEDALVKHNLKDSPILVTDDHNLAVLQNIYHQNKGGVGEAPEAKGNKAAFDIATTMVQSFKSQREEFGTLGKVIGFLENYAGMRTYDKLKVASDRDGFIQFLLSDSIDSNETFFGLTPEQKQLRAEQMFDHISTGDNTDFSRHRSIHFKDANSEFTFLKKYGEFDSHHAAFDAQAKNTAKVAGLMFVFGPNYKETFATLLARAIPDKTQAEASLVNKMFKDASGQLSKKIDSTGGEIAKSARILMAIRQLPGTVLSALAPDLVASAALAKTVSGKGILPSLGTSVSSWWGQAPLSNRAEGRIRLGKIMMLQSYTGLSSFADESSLGVSGYLSKQLTEVFKKSRLQSHSDSIRVSLAATLGNIFHEQINVGYKDLPQQMKDTFMRYKITEANWEIMKKGKVTVDAGLDIHVLSPERISQLTDVSTMARTETYVRYGALINDYAKMSTLESTPFSRQVLYWGTIEGSFPGEMHRLMGQYKQAGVNTMVLQSFLSGSMDKAAYAGTLGLFGLSGYLTYMARELLLKGRTPEFPGIETTEDKMRWIRISADSLSRGAGGLLGDFVNAEYHKGYMNLAGSVAGPVITDLSKIAKFGAALGRWEQAENKTEMINYLKTWANPPVMGGAVLGVPGIKPLLDGLVLDNIHNFLDHNHDTNVKRKLKQHDQRRIKDILTEAF
jgi:hypothetical protein